MVIRDYSTKQQGREILFHLTTSTTSSSSTSCSSSRPPHRPLPLCRTQFLRRRRGGSDGGTVYGQSKTTSIRVSVKLVYRPADWGFGDPEDCVPRCSPMRYHGYQPDASLDHEYSKCTDETSQRHGGTVTCYDFSPTDAKVSSLSVVFPL